MTATRITARQRPTKRWFTRPIRLSYFTNRESGVPWGAYGWPDLATTATAGTPGAFTPEDSYKPYELDDMGSTVADPTTAWTTGQHVVLGDSSSAYWNGTAWTAGTAP